MKMRQEESLVSDMSRVELLERLYTKRKEIKEFDYDKLITAPMSSILTINDIGDLHNIATSIKYAGNVDKKKEMIDQIMKRRGFKFYFSGTNRVAYRFLELPSLISKVAVDKIGTTDTPAEYRNQFYIKPFCTKIFEVAPYTGAVGFMEKVNPITSKAEFLSVADDIFTLMKTKIIGKHVADDLGCKSYMNFGVRHLSNGCTFGPVVLDFPYLYKLDPAKTICKRELDGPYGKYICGGEIDYDTGFDKLVCSCCGRVYTAQELSDDTPDVKIFMFGQNINGRNIKMGTQIISGGKVIMDSGRVTESYMSRNEYTYGIEHCDGANIIKAKNIKPRQERISSDEYRFKALNELQKQYYDDIAEKNKTLKVVKANNVYGAAKIDDEIPSAIPEIAAKLRKVSTITNPEGEKIYLILNDRNGVAEKLTIPESSDISEYQMDPSDRVLELSENDEFVPIEVNHVQSESEVETVGLDEELEETDEIERVEVDNVIDESSNDEEQEDDEFIDDDDETYESEDEEEEDSDSVVTEETEELEPLEDESVDVEEPSVDKSVVYDISEENNHGYPKKRDKKKHKKNHKGMEEY